MTPSKPNAQTPQPQTVLLVNRSTNASPEQLEGPIPEDAPPPAYSPGSDPSVAQQAYQNRDAKGRLRQAGPKVVNVGPEVNSPSFGLPTPPLDVNKNKRPSSSSGSFSQGYQRSPTSNVRAPVPVRQQSFQSFHTPPRENVSSSMGYSPHSQPGLFFSKRTPWYSDLRFPAFSARYTSGDEFTKV